MTVPESERESRLSTSQIGTDGIFRRLDAQDIAISAVQSRIDAIYAAIVGTLNDTGIRQRIHELTDLGADHEERIGTLEIAAHDRRTRFGERIWQLAQMPVSAMIGAMCYAIANHWTHK